MKNKTSVREITQIKWENVIIRTALTGFTASQILNAKYIQNLNNSYFLGEVASIFCITLVLFILVGIYDVGNNFPLTEKIKVVVQDDDKK